MNGRVLIGAEHEGVALRLVGESAEAVEADVALTGGNHRMETRVSFSRASIERFCAALAEMAEGDAEEAEIAARSGAVTLHVEERETGLICMTARITEGALPNVEWIVRTELARADLARHAAEISGALLDGRAS